MKLNDVINAGMATGRVKYKAHEAAEVVEFDIRFNLSAFTPAWELSESVTNEDGTPKPGGIVKMLLNILVWMDLADDNDVNIPVTESVLMTFPFALLSAIFDVINQTAMPEKKLLSASGGSFQA